MSTSAVLLPTILGFIASTMANSDSICPGANDYVSGIGSCSNPIINSANSHNLFYCDGDPFSVPGSSGICYNGEYILSDVAAGFIIGTNSFINMQSSSSLNLWGPTKLATNCQINVGYDCAIWTHGSIIMHPGALWEVGRRSELGNEIVQANIALTIGASAKFVMGISSAVTAGNIATLATLTLNDGTSLMVGNSSLLHLGVNATLTTLSLGKVADMVIENRVSLTISDCTTCLVFGPVKVSNLTEPVVWSPGFKGGNIICTSSTVMSEIMMLIRLNTTEADKSY